MEDSRVPERFDGAPEQIAGGTTGLPPVDDDPSIVYDRAALEAAERDARTAVSADDALSAHHGEFTERDEPWVKIATAPSADPGRSLEPIYEALCEAGIPAGFDPYRPGVAASPYPFLQRAFFVVVPESRLEEATRALADMGVDIPGSHSDRVDRGGQPAPTATPDSARVHADQVGAPPEPRAAMPRSRKVMLLVALLLLLATAIQLITTLLYELGILE